MTTISLLVGKTQSASASRCIVGDIGWHSFVHNFPTECRQRGLTSEGRAAIQPKSSSVTNAARLALENAGAVLEQLRLPVVELAWL